MGSICMNLWTSTRHNFCRWHNFGVLFFGCICDLSLDRNDKVLLLLRPHEPTQPNKQAMGHLRMFGAAPKQMA